MPHQHKLPLFALITCALIPSVAVPQAAPAAGPVIMRSADRALVARADGPRCAPRVAITITAGARSFFEGRAPAVLSLIQSLRSGLSVDCPAMERLVVRGVVNGTQGSVYSALAERPNGWSIFVLAAGQVGLGAVAPSASGPANARDIFVRGNSSVPISTILDEARRMPTMCLESQDNGRTCGIIVEFSGVSASSATTTTRQQISGGAEAVIVTTASVRDRVLLCENAGSRRVEIRGGTLSPAGRNELRQSVEERAASVAGACSGYVGADGRYRAQTFAADGRSTGAGMTAILVAGQPNLTVRQQ